MFIAIILFIIIIVSGAICWSFESRSWNNGVCRESGLQWRQFDIDSQGGRGYTDDSGNYCWISWPVDKR